MSYADLLGVREEDALLVLPGAEDVTGRAGFLHGGALAGLLELAARRAMGGGGAVVTASVDYLRPAPTGDALAEGRVVRRGRRFAHVEASAWQDDRDKPVATGRFVFRVG
jgi:uncharacterized protein (TIGR00369 family)